MEKFAKNVLLVGRHLNFCKGKNVCLYYTKKQANVLKNVFLRLRGGKDVKNLQMF